MIMRKCSWVNMTRNLLKWHSYVPVSINLYKNVVYIVRKNNKRIDTFVMVLPAALGVWVCGILNKIE